MRTLIYRYSKPVFDTPELLIKSFGIQETLQPKINNKIDGAGNFLLMYFYKEAHVKENKTIKIVPPGTLIIWEPEVETYYGNPDKMWNHTWLNIDGRFFRDILKDNEIPLNSVIPFKQFAIIEKYMIDLYNELIGYACPDIFIIKNILKNCFHEIARALKGGDNIAIPQTYKEIRQYIDSNYNKDFLLVNLAKRVRCTPQYFCTIFRQYFGFSPIEYQTCLRMRQAAFLLRDHNLSISQIGEAVGYDDIYYFSGRFKKFYGMSPKKMREQNMCI